MQRLAHRLGGLAALVMLTMLPIAAHASMHTYPDRDRVIRESVAALQELEKQPGVDVARIEPVRQTIAAMSPLTAFGPSDIKKLEVAQQVLADYGRENTALNNSLIYAQAILAVKKALAWTNHVVNEHGGHLEGPPS